MTYRDPVAEVFRLPELVSLIVQHRLEPYVPGRREQYWPLACVARSWLDPVTSIAWRRMALHKLFAATIEPGRRQYYADRVRHLRIIYLESMNEQLSTLSFRKLESVDIYERSDDNVLPSADVWVHSLLGPSLRSLALWSEEMVPKDLPVSLRNLCPDLETLHISLRENDPSSVLMLAEIVEALQRLRKLKLKSKLHHSTSISTERMLCSLSALSHLELLEFEGMIPDLTQVSSQFPQLTSLRGEATHPTLLRIGLLMPSLVNLDLELPPRYVAEPPTLVIAPLGSLIKLESLTLRVQGDAPLESKDLQTLAKFCNLSRLYIGAGRRKVPAPDFTDETLCSILKCLPLLESLELRLRHPSGGQALSTLVKHCRNLRVIYIPGHYDLALFLSLPQQPAFPDLGTLCVASLFFGHVRPNFLVSRTEFRMIHEVLAQHAPKLSYINFADPWWDIGKRLNAALGKGWDAPCACGEPGQVHKQIDHIDEFEDSG